MIDESLRESSIEWAVTQEPMETKRRIASFLFSKACCTSDRSIAYHLYVLQDKKKTGDE